MQDLTCDEIKAFRSQHKWTQAELAERLGLSIHTIASWERKGATIAGGWRYALFNIAHGMLPAYSNEEVFEILKAGRPWPYRFQRPAHQEWGNWLEFVKAVKTEGNRHGVTFIQEGHPDQFPTTLTALQTFIQPMKV